DAHLAGELTGGVLERLADDGGSLRVDHRGKPGVAADAYLGVERDRAEEGDALALGPRLRAAVTEDVVAVAAVRARVVRHVLDEAEQRDLQLAEHADGLSHVEERDVLRRADDDGARDGDRL